MSPDAGAPSAGRLQRFAAALLQHQGAAVETVDPEGLDVLAPPAVQQALGIDELSRFGFGATLPPDSRRIGIEGEWLERFGQMLGAGGRWMERVLPLTTGAPGSPEQLLDQTLVLDNATHRLLGVEPAWTRYLLLDFRATAASDDKRDFMLQLGINLATGIIPDTVIGAFAPALDAFSPEADRAAPPPNTDLPAMWDHDRVLDLTARALPSRLEAALAPFVRSLHRRLERGQERLFSYHNDLYREAMGRALALPEGNPKRRREEQRCEAVGHDYHAKLDDLARQFATRVSIAWMQTTVLTMPVYRFAVQLRRRKAERTIQIDWNPLARRLEAPTCEASTSLQRPRMVCDDVLHLVAPAHLAPCSGCGRAFCRACHPEQCPKCKMRC